MARIRKYLYIIRHHVLKSIEYRGEVLTWIALSLFPNLVLLLIWLSVYGSATQIHGYQLPAILQYFLLGTLINGISAVHFEQFRAQEIREGKIDHFIVQPVSYPMKILLSEIGGKIFYLSVLLPCFIISYIVLMKFFPLGQIHLSIYNVLQFSLLMFAGFLIEFAFALGATFMTFWFEGADGLEHFKWIIVSMLTGWMIPVVFMPPWLQLWVMKLPFHYMYATPIAIIQNQQSLSLTDIAYLGGFLLAMYTALYFLWRKAVYRYTSAGG